LVVVGEEHSLGVKDMIDFTRPQENLGTCSVGWGHVSVKKHPGRLARVESYDKIRLEFVPIDFLFYTRYRESSGEHGHTDRTKFRMRTKNRPFSVPAHVAGYSGTEIFPNPGMRGTKF
jgi:hypothetical protein